MAYIKPTDRKKPWAKRQLPEKRSLGNLDIRNLFRIYCEGGNTEPEYFKGFPVNTETKVEAIGLGRSKTALVEKAIELCKKDNLLKGQTNYDEDRQLWVVFDFDISGKNRETQDYNNAIQLAQRNEIQVAYSNDSFELWLVLHFQYHTAAVTRNEFYKILSNILNCNYEDDGKSKLFSQSLYQILIRYQVQAIQNSRRLHESKIQEVYSNQNPCTTVYLLVEELNKCVKK